MGALLFRATRAIHPDGHLDLSMQSVFPRCEACSSAGRAAKLAVVVAVLFAAAAAVFGADTVVLEKPQPTRAMLADGRVVGGAIARWDDDGFDGPIGRFAWADLKPLEAYRIRRRLIDEREATPPPRDPSESSQPSPTRRTRLLELATWAWSIDEPELAARALRDAKATGAGADELELTKVAGAEKKTARVEKAASAAREKLRSTSPESDVFSPDLWPPPDADRAAHVDVMRKDATAKLAAAGRECTAIEGKHAVVYSDLGAEDASNRAVLIDEFVASCLGKLGVGKEELPFWGKLVVIVADGDDRFRLIEASGFRQKTSETDAGFAHYDGPKAFVVAKGQADVTSTTIAIFRGVALAVLHRHVSATRLPPWANEGLADWLVASYPKGKQLDELLRKPGLAFFREGGSIEKVFDLTYEAGSWPGPRNVGRPVGFLMVGYMIEREPQRFQRFLGAVKRGKPWREALESDFGAKPNLLLDAARRYYRTND
ncbi:MAG: hypothetical protein SGJ09_00755 [Phycisphaerae bacterium]|nr:hypothetical protein [Phycisphaerae bacterium]